MTGLALTACLGSTDGDEEGLRFLRSGALWEPPLLGGGVGGVDSPLVSPPFPVLLTGGGGGITLLNGAPCQAPQSSSDPTEERGTDGLSRLWGLEARWISMALLAFSLSLCWKLLPWALLGGCDLFLSLFPPAISTKGRGQGRRF